MKLVALAGAWIVGLFLGLETGVPVPAIALFSVAAAALALILLSRGLSPWPGILMVMLLMGVVRVEVSGESAGLPPLDGLHTIKVRGLVVSDPELAGPGVEFEVAVEAVDRGAGWEDMDGKVLVLARPTENLVQARGEPYFEYGDTLELVGRLQAPPALGNFDYGAYLAAQGIHSTMPFPDVRLVGEGGGNPALGVIYRLRGEISEGTDRALPEPQASLAQALLLGKRGGLPRDVTENFRSTGTSHLLAISGLHVGTLLALALMAGAWLVGRRRQLYLCYPWAPSGCTRYSAAFPPRWRGRPSWAASISWPWRWGGPGVSCPPWRSQPRS